VGEGRKVQGLCSKYLNDVYEAYLRKPPSEGGESEFCNIFVKSSMFDIPSDPKTPILMVGPGTGVVPFIGFIEERSQQLGQNSEI